MILLLVILPPGGPYAQRTELSLTSCVLVCVAQDAAAVNGPEDVLKKNRKMCCPEIFGSNVPGHIIFKYKLTLNGELKSV